jgi:protein-tyrosine phosphatase
MHRHFKVTEMIDGRVFQRGEFRKFPLEYKLEELKHLGVTAVLNVCPKIDPELANAFPGYRYMPLSDAPVMTNDRLDKIFKAAEWAGFWLEQDPNRKLLVHCRAGRNRSSLMSAMLMVRLLKESGSFALELTRDRRPRALDNPAFEHLLHGISSWDEKTKKYRMGGPTQQNGVIGRFSPKSLRERRPT